VSKMSNLLSPDVFFLAQNAAKSVSGEPRTQLGELTTLATPPSRLGGGNTYPIPLPLDAFGVSALRPHYKILATPMPVHGQNLKYPTYLAD